MAGNPLASLPGLPQRPSLARSSASETRLTQPGIEGARSRKLNSAPTAAFRIMGWVARPAEYKVVARRPRHSSPRDFRLAEPIAAPRSPDIIVRRQPTRETSLVVSRKSTQAGAHVHVRFDEGARLVDERRPV